MTQPTQQTVKAQPRPPKKKKHRVRRVLGALLVIVLLLAAGGYTLLYLAAGKVEYRALPEADARAVAAAPSKLGVTNILFIGVDSRLSTNTRADTMLLLSLDSAHRKLKLTSFLRDSWVEIPGNGQNRLNAACSLGGAPLTVRTISENFKIHIDHYVLLNYDTFERVVDALEGVDVPITADEIDFLCSTTRLGKKIGKESMQRQMAQDGAVHLDGEQALIFCRIRKLDDDFMRTRRQRILLEAIVEKCRHNPLLWVKVAQNVLPELKTDMTQFTIANLGLRAPLCLGYEIASHQVPASGSFTYANKNGASVIDMNITLNAQLLKDFVEQK